MMFDLPDSETLYAALLARDETYEGRAYVGVTSTGIFCRLSCPARKPKRENCQFHATPGACIEAGFRPCKRCTPLAAAAGEDPMVQQLLAALEERPAYRWREGDVARMGFDPSTVRRSFRRHFGMTFLEMARQRRLREGFTTLKAGEPVIAAQIEAGFESPSAFRAAFARLTGLAPGSFRQDALLLADWIDTPLGAMIAVSCPHRLHLLEFADRKALPREMARLQSSQPGGIGFGRPAPTQQVAEELQRYFSGDSARFETPIALHGSAFQREVWDYLRAIPAGETRSYSQIAQELGRPSSSRAVARANGSNQLALVVPCHRVLSADGNLTGYGGGLWRKQRLIEIEADLAKRARPQAVSTQ
ncbi:MULTISPECIES: bifunctional transcriptional activator/DNA repair enzyme AdaA [Rhodobacterales]|jgi:AraC family transcriptional regulator of adaptative response/methylated-DNA-[protein]-cysteine methyltransferase|uniref:bifunctional transcriptional activator/DNA repair enzyme AdaA n=1 Tax=Rhodobacterales TaxID=204455 RepID=UPI00237FBF26|nr:trifunctional transcriptional activator/DNA repair protein Ada/methylated-DNA--[protein]-cysteine S-methyltransferase [Phaeobacter gallaeciensis]MDE4141853.1 trifunctional transcriptional activator/DNA repair protein Ada/methylated-DNA--[protein]-cysteine S-methyltransferase [Phaeobacter gallaeciensis]MDE4150199.1 trifunctional transcriptional activator/DNA repair protein Ada/methylated-DNA--[protein]-cysteine S-methyltransferase [Phaeobacter gallaeciensis]MDE4154524.1 trifunctional transcrip